MKAILVAVALQTGLLSPPIINPENESVTQEETVSKSFDVMVDNCSVQQNIVLTQNKSLQIFKKGYETVEVYVDNQILDVQWNNDQAVTILTPSNKEVRIVGIDEKGIQDQRVIQIIGIEKPQFNFDQEGQYTLDSHIHFTMEDATSYQFELMNKTQSTSAILSYQELQSYVLKQEGEYLIRAIHNDYPTIQWDCAHFFFTNKKPNVTLLTNVLKPSKDVQCTFTLDTLWLKEAYIEIQDEKGGQRLEYKYEVLIRAKKDEEQKVKVSVVGIDLFGQESRVTKVIEIDDKKPGCKIDINGNLANKKGNYLDQLVLYQISWDEEVSEEKEIRVNGVSVHSKDEIAVFNSLKPLDVMEVIYKAVDRAGNQSEEVVEIHKNQTVFPVVNQVVQKPDLTQPAVVEAVKIQEEKIEEKVQPVVSKVISIEDYQVQERVYSLNDEKEIVLQEKVIRQRTNPSIAVRFFSPQSHSVKFLMKEKQEGLKNKVVWVKVNGKKVRVKKPKRDAYGNLIYEIKLKEKKNKVEIKVMNEQGDSSKVQKVVYLKPLRQQTPKWYQSILSWVKQNLIHD